VSILFVTDETICRLNRQYRAIDSATDVLAFSMREGEDADLHPELMGDVVISVETARRQAQEAGHSLERELAILLVHGILHLAGFDHLNPEEAHLMESRSREIWEHIQSEVADHV